jgi:hypothetical protein
MKKQIHHYYQMNMDQILKFGNEQHNGNFTLKLTNYTCTMETEKKKYIFASDQVDKKTFQFFQLINKQVAGELREIQGKIKYYDFTGIKENEIESCFCVDLNSAYLQVLKNEKVIDQETFTYIDKESRKTKEGKMARLKSVGLFAKNPMLMIYENGQIKEFKQERNPFSWVFFIACLKTCEAMEIIKKEFPEEFLFYWVDGIFIKKNSEKIRKRLLELGFPSKTENIKNLEKSEKNICYMKDNKEKILFLPKTYSEEISNIKETFTNIHQL